MNNGWNFQNKKNIKFNTARAVAKTVKYFMQFFLMNTVKFLNNRNDYNKVTSGSTIRKEIVENNQDAI